MLRISRKRPEFYAFNLKAVGGPEHQNSRVPRIMRFG